MDTRLIPTDGGWVRKVGVDRDGRVAGKRRRNDAIEVGVKWSGTTHVEWLELKDLESGFKLGMEVQDVPRSRTRKPLGEGVVIETRRIGSRDQVLVEFPSTGQRSWLPYENLRQIKGPVHRFVLGQIGDAGNAERFRLKCLAHAIEAWNENTGSLSRLDIDPLPHQIHLVHRILASGNLNWLIADDVGLGKTIEVGMLLAALEHRGVFRRILLVTPAGLVKQWQEELHHKFGMSDFQIYGTDFDINDPRHWKLHDRVIGSVDRFKSEDHYRKLLQAGQWDLIVFDEAHRLTRRQWGQKYESSDRFKLAAELRKTTDAMLLLSATPHQGMHDKFQALLELLRPELKSEIQTLALNPELIRDLVIRNHKADVTDAKGEFIFHGKVTKAVEVVIGDEEREFDAALQKYLREGYESSRRKGKAGMPIGFVMTTYRKLAASSIAAITVALERRASRLRGDAISQRQLEIEDARFAGEQEEIWSGEQAIQQEEFFEGELRAINSLLEKGAAVSAKDRKLAAFLDSLVGAVRARNPSEKLLVFTEYRATQDYLAKSLRQRIADDSVSLINGGMSWEEREHAIAKFEDKGLFLISTEAGGEGLNLHRQCHVMVNYDLPWNPMRLVQRIGRLYRYGQKQKVVVFNMHAPQTVDAQIMALMYARIGQVVSDMFAIGEEFRDGLEDEILGELAEMLDVNEILEEATQLGIDRTRERIDEALRLARDAVEKQRELFEFASGYDPNETRKDLAIDPRHVRAFLDGMFSLLGIEVIEKTHNERVFDIRLPDGLAGQIAEAGRRLRVTLDRDIAAARSNIQMLDVDAPLFRDLLETAKAHGFDGICAGTSELTGRAVLTSMLRWQNDQGLRMRKEFTTLLIDEAGKVSVNPTVFSEWLLQQPVDRNCAGSKEVGRALAQAAEEAISQRLADISNASLHPESRQFINAGWIEQK